MYCKEIHMLGREAYIIRMEANMRQTRAQFKYSLRLCRRHINVTNVDKLASKLLMQIRMISGEKLNISHVIKRYKPTVLMDINEMITLLFFGKNIILASSIGFRNHHLIPIIFNLIPLIYALHDQDYRD